MQQQKACIEGKPHSISQPSKQRTNTAPSDDVCGFAGKTGREAGCPRISACTLPETALAMQMEWWVAARQYVDTFNEPFAIRPSTRETVVQTVQSSEILHNPTADSDKGVDTVTSDNTVYVTTFITVKGRQLFPINL